MMVTLPAREGADFYQRQTGTPTNLAFTDIYWVDKEPCMYLSKHWLEHHIFTQH